MHQIPNSIAILGNGVLAVDATLRKVLTFKECSGPLVILDYTGRGAMILNRENMMGLSRRNVEWHNLADRMRPISLFHFHQSEHMKRIMFEYLQSVRKLMNIDILGSKPCPPPFTGWRCRLDLPPAVACGAGNPPVVHG